MSKKWEKLAIQAFDRNDLYDGIRKIHGAIWRAIWKEKDPQFAAELVNLGASKLAGLDAWHEIPPLVEKYLENLEKNGFFDDQAIFTIVSLMAKDEKSKEVCKILDYLDKYANANSRFQNKVRQVIVKTLKELISSSSGNAEASFQYSQFLGYMYIVLNKPKDAVSIFLNILQSISDASDYAKFVTYTACAYCRENEIEIGFNLLREAKKEYNEEIKTPYFEVASEIVQAVRSQDEEWFNDAIHLSKRLTRSDRVLRILLKNLQDQFFPRSSSGFSLPF